MAENEKNVLEKIILAGIGSLAISNEKAEEMLDECVKRGEITVEQGKTIREELKHNFETKMHKLGKPAHDFVASQIVHHLEKMSPDERKQIISKFC